jgi:hypothetical protein
MIYHIKLMFKILWLCVYAMILVLGLPMIKFTKRNHELN